MDSSHGMRPSGQEHVVGEEYTFTDRELQDILVFLEYTNKPGAPKLEPSNLPHIPPVLGRGSPTFIASQLPMQFQPHMPPHASQHTSPTTLPPHSFNPVKQEHHAISQGPAPMHVQYRLAGAMPPVSAAPSISMGLMPSMNGMANIPVYHQSLSMRELYNPSHTAASAGPVTSAQLPQTSTAIPTSSQSPKPAGPGESCILYPSEFRALFANLFGSEF